MEKFVTSNSDEYWKEKDRREKIYRDNCKKSGELWDKRTKDDTDENHRAFFDFFPNVDKSYLDWQEGVEYVYTDE